MTPARQRALGVATLLALGAFAVLALLISPKDSRHGDAVRLLYVHAPTAWTAYLAYVVAAIASAMWLWPRTRRPSWDHLAGAAAEFGVLSTGLTLFLGSVWAKESWGTWWQWEARLTTTAVLFFVYLGYLALRRLGGPGAERRNAIAALLAVVQVPIVHFSVTWWRSIHQEGSVFNQRGEVEINDATMQWALWSGVIAFTLLFLWCCLLRMRTLVLESSAAETALDAAIRERVGTVNA